MCRYFVLLTILLLNACENVHINAAKTVTDPLPETNPANTLVWNFTSPTLRTGESITFGFSNGGSSFTTDPFGIGTFDSTTLVYTAPINQAPVNHTIGASDDSGNSGTNSIKIAGFQTGERFEFPLTFGEQNYVKSSAVLDNGAIFTTSVINDSPGWERWVVNRSTDEGLTWELVDHYVPFEEGEAHPMAMINKGNDLYVCGYIWDNNTTNYASEWVVKKSSDNGVTWTIVDQYVEHDWDNHVCYDITVSASGNLYAVGSNDTDGGVIRESIDDGATWTTIGKIPGVFFLAAVEVSPAGVVWTVDYDGHLRKGTFALGVWNWVDAGPVMGTLGGGGYELYGDLEIVSENEAYFSGNSSSWKIMKTTDGGTTWNEVYTGAATYRGVDIKRLSTGELVAIGTQQTVVFGGSDTFKIIRSTDDGATWNETYSNSSPSANGITLVETATSLMAFGVFDKAPYQIINLRSTDAGATWAHRSYIFYKENLYTYVADFKVDGLGNLWATGDLQYIDDSFFTPWSVIKSTDDGANWTNSDLFVGTTHDASAEALAIGPSNEVYVAGNVDNNDSIKKSTDSGTSWNVVDTNIGVLSSRKKMASDSNGNIYMAGTTGFGANSIVRKGTVNGTVWNTIVTFPIEPGHTNFSLLAFNVFDDDDSIWIAGRERNTTPVFTTVIYYSADGGASFTEVFRNLETNWSSMSIKKASNGDVYAHTLYKVIKTSNNGASWEDVYDGTLAGATIRGFQFDNLGRLYILNSNEQVLTQNQFDSSWFVMYDYSLINLVYGSSLEYITDCGNMSQVCLIGRYDISVVGAISEMIPLVIP